MTAEKRLELVVRCTNLLRGEIERNSGRYDGRMVPNLTSITDLCTIEDAYLSDAENSIVTLETLRGVRSGPTRHPL